VTLARDISTADALAHLSVRDRGPHALDRRRFLQLVGMGAGAGLVGGGAGSVLEAFAPGHDPAAWALGPVGPNDGILVIIGMFGGNDGLNTIVPIDDGAYYAQHGGLAIAPEATLPLDAANGLHPALPALKQWWDRGQLAVVQGVGYPQPDESHFNSMAYWMAGQPHAIPSTGWIGRWLDGYLAGQQHLFAAAEIGSSVPLHLVGAASRGTGVPARSPGWGSETDAASLRAYDAVRAMRTGAAGPWFQAVGQAVVDSIDVNATLAPIIPDDDALPDTEIVRKLEIAARLINANLGFRVLTAGWGDFDSHAGQPGMHPVRMQELNEAVTRFFGVLDPAWASRVTVMTFSEFGRTSYANDGQGTDHGSAAAQLVFGQNVRGGFYGARPALAGLSRWQRMTATVDLRSYYTSIIDGWMGGGGSDVLGGTYENLGLFAHAAGSPGGTPYLPPYVGSPTGGFVATDPFRAADTRLTAAPLGPGGVLRVPIGGNGPVPVGAAAVVANVTAVDATEPHYFTVYPGGSARPETSNINGGPGRPVPNLVVMGVGNDGHIEIYNSHGSTHCLVDVFGYFTGSVGSAGGDRFTAVAPQRLFDTRSGYGVRPGKLGELEPVEIAVAGHVGVPADATAVVLNLTATHTDGPGFLRLTPAGQAPAETSNVNFFAGDTVPNLAICRLGGGRLVLDGAGPGKHAIGDVFGYFSESGERLQPAAPQRLLDTRTGVGTAAAPIGPERTIDVAVAGSAGVPADATAVVLNVAATNVAGPSFVTVWPRGQEMPGTSNLNVMPGQTIANLVICRLGDGGLQIANPIASCDVIADVLGWFRA
jgi:uncharacterized protein (DUF1501 family)